MTSLQTVYVAPTKQGTGDGSSAVNAHAFATDADRTWLDTTTGAWVTELLGNKNDVGLNEATTFRTVKPGFEADYGDKSHITDVRSAVFVRRVCWITDQGPYQFPATITTLKNLPPPPDNPLTAGTTGQPPIRMFHFVGYRSSDGKMTHQVPSGTTTSRSVTLPAKAGDPSTWSTASNYTLKDSGPNAMNNWSGATVSATKTWTVTDPSPIRAVIKGTRTPDPRTAAQIAAKVQWGVGVPITVDDPDSALVEPNVKDSTGQVVSLTKGQLWDPTAQTVTTVTTAYNTGQYAFLVAGSGLCMQGFEFRDVQSPISYGGNGGIVPNHFHAYRDIVVNNAKYCIWRGDYKYDVECTRWVVIGVSQKHFGPGVYNQRWNISDIRADGNWCVGDQFPCLVAAADGNTPDANAFHAGAFRLSRIIVENMWTGTQVGSTYVNGDGIEFEAWGIAIRDYYVDLTPDGGIDNKTKPYWVNWPATVVFNAYLGRNKRAHRSWHPTGYPEKTAPHILRDVTMDDARQIGLFLVSDPAHHKFVDWHNPDGRANFLNTRGRTFIAVSNAGNVGGNMDAVIHQCFDARTTGVVSTGLNGNTALDPVTFRARLWTPETPPVPLTLAVNGTTTDDGSPVSVAAGSTVTVTFPGLPAGTVITPTVSGPSTVTQSGSTVTVTAEV